MKLHVFIIVDLLALAFAVATLWLMYESLQRNPQRNAAQEQPYGEAFDDDEIRDAYGRSHF